MHLQCYPDAIQLFLDFRYRVRRRDAAFVDVNGNKWAEMRRNVCLWDVDFLFMSHLISSNSSILVPPSLHEKPALPIYLHNANQFSCLIVPPPARPVLLMQLYRLLKVCITTVQLSLIKIRMFNLEMKSWDNKSLHGFVKFSFICWFL